MKKRILKVIIILLIIIVSKEIFSILNYKYNNKKEVISYYKNETNYNYKNVMLINIPSINLKSVVKKADNNFKNLDKNLVYYKNNNYEDKITIFGHSGMGVGVFFNRIDELNKDSIVKLYIDNNELIYIFDKKYNILSSDISILNNDCKNTLLLITCNKEDKSKRLVVKFTLKSRKTL